jgi:DNA polymerase-3 subunit delta'
VIDTLPAPDTLPESAGPELSGHSPAWQEWRAALASTRLHHAWLLTGPQGIGKGHFARAAAAELVAQPGVVQPHWDRHADIHLLDHLPSSDAEEAKRAEGKEFQTRRNITIDQIRRMQQRLNTRPTLGERRAIIIDPADDLEKGAVNALLKSLEEPPIGTFFLLVAHRPGRLPPTIRSSCRVLRFAPLADAEIETILAREAPEADHATRAAAIAAAQGSPGMALGFVNEALGPAYLVMQAIMRDGDSDLALRANLAEALGARPGRLRLAAVLDLARAVVARELPHSNPQRQSALIEAHAALVQLSGQAPTYNFDAGLLAMEIGGLLGMAAMPREKA